MRLSLLCVGWKTISDLNSLRFFVFETSWSFPAIRVPVEARGSAKTAPGSDPAAPAGDSRGAGQVPTVAAARPAATASPPAVAAAQPAPKQPPQPERSHGKSSVRVPQPSFQFVWLQQQSVLQQHQQLTNQNHHQPKSRMPRKADGKPRGRMSAYAFFVQTCSEEHKKKHPDENVVFAEFSKKCAERWKVRMHENLLG